MAVSFDLWTYLKHTFGLRQVLALFSGLPRNKAKWRAATVSLGRGNRVTFQVN